MNKQTLPPAAKPAFKPILCCDKVIAILEYYASAEQGEIILQALGAHGHLIKTQSASGSTLRMDFSQFADQIEASVSQLSVSQQKTVSTLREVHVLNTRQHLPPKNMGLPDEGICDTAAATV